MLQYFFRFNMLAIATTTDFDRIGTENCSISPFVILLNMSWATMYLRDSYGLFFHRSLNFRAAFWIAKESFDFLLRCRKIVLARLAPAMNAERMPPPVIGLHCAAASPSNTTPSL